MIEVRLIGAINNPGLKQVDESSTFKQLLEEHGNGMLKKYPRPIVFQVGGPLGTVVRGTRINDRVRDHLPETRTARIVAFFGERFCPVDFLRFLTRFLVREARVDTPHVREVNRIIEDISAGHGTHDDLDRLRELAAIENGIVYGEHRLNVIIDDLMDIFGDDFVQHAVGKYCHFSVCRQLFHMNAPCSNTCPSNMNVPGYIELIKHDRLNDAYTLMKRVRSAQSHESAGFCGLSASVGDGVGRLGLVKWASFCGIEGSNTLSTTAGTPAWMLKARHVV